VSIASPPARLRGTAAGLLTAALAVAAHSMGSGAPPTGAVVAQLAVLAATVGALTATIARAADARILLGLLAAGQVCSHVDGCRRNRHRTGPVRTVPDLGEAARHPDDQPACHTDVFGRDRREMGSADAARRS
jgi:hypothetical protein